MASSNLPGIQEDSTLIVAWDATSAERLVPIKGDFNALHVYMGSHLAGDRFSDSTIGEDVKAVAEEWELSDQIVLASGGTVLAGPCLVRGVAVEAAVTTAGSFEDNSVTKFAIPVLALGWHECPSTVFYTDATIPAGGVGTVRVWYRKLDPDVAW